MNIFLYDYTNLTKSIMLFGYDEYGRKCYVDLRGFAISCDIEGSGDYFDSFIYVQKTIEDLSVQGKFGKSTYISYLVTRWEVVEVRGFKGVSWGERKLQRVHFESFDHYEQFKRTIAYFNEYVMYLAGPEKKDATYEAKTCYYAFTYRTGQTELRRAPIRVLEDDIASKYIYKLQRHNKLLMSGWNRVESIERVGTNNSRLGFVCYVGDVSPLPDQAISMIPLTVMSWDIEVSTESGKFDSNGHNPLNRIVCICYTVGSAMSMESARRQVCIQSTLGYGSGNEDSSLPYTFSGDIEMIRVENELYMILKFGECVYREDPSFLTGFNDSSFDWPFLRQKLEYYSDPEFYGYKEKALARTAKETYLKMFAGLLQGTRYDANGRSLKDTGYIYATRPSLIFKSSDVKVTAGNTRKGISVDVPGIICIDTRTLLMKDQVLERRSLNEYLKANNLPLKLEVSFDEMNRAFKALVDEEQEEGDDLLSLRESLELSALSDYAEKKKTLTRIYEYCVYDADACRLLWAKRNLVYQQMQICKMSFTPLRAGFMNANGIKVRNMVAAFAHDLGFAVPMSTTSHDIRLRDKRLLDEYEKYPGAYVPEPHKGVSLTPVIALDFASLYPSIIMAHNLSPEKVVEEEDIQEVTPNFTDLYDRVTLKNGRQLLCNRVIVDFEKNFKTANIKAYVLAREEGVGVYPAILQNLFNMRAQVKKTLEHIDEQIKHAPEDQTADLLYQYSLVDAKQKAIKVFMNTFYGETGNQQSSLFDVVISGGTTSYGQKYIKQVHYAIGDRDCEVVAGDTDSIYFRPRASHYYLTPHTTCDYVLEQANAIADQMRLFVNDFIGKQTHGFLKMAFEELLCPSVFTGKKKYFGAMYKPGDAHRASVDFAVRGSVLIKGIDFIKSQYPDLIKKHGYQLINSLLNAFNDQLKTQITPELFLDNSRTQFNQILLDLCTDRSIEFLNDVKRLQPDYYQLISSKKRMRDATGGEMAGFRTRIMSRLSPNNEVQEPLRIYTETLYELNIPVPLVGEVLDILYIKPVVFKRDLQSAEKMHLLEFAQKTNYPLDHAEYLKMFATSAVRISLAAQLPPNIDELDPGNQQIHFNKAQKTLKQHFSIAQLTANRPLRIIQTVLEVRQTQDVQYIRETFYQSPCLQFAADAKTTLNTSFFKSFKKLSDEQIDDVLDYIADLIDHIPDPLLITTLIVGSRQAPAINSIISASEDNRFSFLLNYLSYELCIQLQDLPDYHVRSFILLSMLHQKLNKLSLKTPLAHF